MDCHANNKNICTRCNSDFTLSSDGTICSKCNTGEGIDLLHTQKVCRLCDPNDCNIFS